MTQIYYRHSYHFPALWLDSVDGMVPENYPVVAGHDVSGEMLYVGRAIHNGDTIPGKVVRSHSVCYVAYNGGEHPHYSYQVLTNPNQSVLAWIPAVNGQVPHGALQGGQQEDGEPLFIGRARHEGTITVGKVHPSHGTCYISFDGNEIPVRTYEVLVACHVLAH